MSWPSAAIALVALVECATAASAPPILISAYDEARRIHATPAPQIRGADRRQVVSTASEFTITVAPDVTCGFLSGSPGNAITCDNGNPCSWEPNNINAIFCGVASDAARLTCLERDSATDTAFCDDVCQSNSFYLRCTDTSAPYCRTYAFPGGVRDYRCAPTPVAAIQSVEFTYDGQTDRAFDTTTLTSEPEATGGTTKDVTSASPSQTSEPSTPSSTSTPDPTSPPPVPEKRNTTPIGAIVGGTVGGVAVIVLLVLGVFFLRRRSSSKADVTPAAGAADHGPTSPMQQYQQQGYPGPPPQGDAYGSVGAKSGLVSPVLSAGYAAPVSPVYEGQQGLQQPQDVNRMSQPFVAAGQGGHQQPVVHEMGLEGGHHKGQLHELH